ncbi:MAG TPA: methylenetetrahydrofolate reductase [Acidimicrobiales bacterium]|nr:methylenetetrahydrofolate reductase [Acidimicrobiales bacterium]
MAKIRDLLAQGPTLSFEFFPPKTDVGITNLREAVDELAPLKPSFISVTYGAGGSTRDLTRDLVIGMNQDYDFPVMAHLTCVGHTQDQVKELLDQYAEGGVENILALGGDPPADGSDPGGDFTYAIELVEVIRAHGADFSIGVATQPELHPRSEDRDTDRRHLAEKLEAADFGVSNFFFDPNDYLLMVEELADLGCHTPVLPGVMLFRDPAGLRRMSAMNQSKLPIDLDERLDACVDPAAVLDVSVDCGGLLCERLLAAGVPGLHLFVLNRADTAKRVLEQLDR